MMRIVLTGASGLVGRALAEHLAGAGHEIIGLARHTPASWETTAWLQADVGDQESMEEAAGRVEGCDVVIHAAADIRPGATALECIRTNALGTAHVLEAARCWSAGYFLYLSSLSVIGRPRVLPIDESHPIGPLTVYGHAKYCGEGISLLAAMDAMPVCALRISSPVGPGAPADRIFGAFVSRALEGADLVLHGRGARRQNYVDVRDIARAALGAINHRSSGVFNIGSARAISNQELAEACVRTLDSSSAIVYSGQEDPDEEVVWDLSVVKASQQFEYEASFRLEDSIRAWRDSRS